MLQYLKVHGFSLPQFLNLPKEYQQVVIENSYHAARLLPWMPIDQFCRTAVEICESLSYNKDVIEKLILVWKLTWEEILVVEKKQILEKLPVVLACLQGWKCSFSKFLQLDDAVIKEVYDYIRYRAGTIFFSAIFKESGSLDEFIELMPVLQWRLLQGDAINSWFVRPDTRWKDLLRLTEGEIEALASVSKEQIPLNDFLSMDEYSRRQFLAHLPAVEAFLRKGALCKDFALLRPSEWEGLNNLHLRCYPLQELKLPLKEFLWQHL